MSDGWTGCLGLGCLGVGQGAGDDQSEAESKTGQGETREGRGSLGGLRDVELPVEEFEFVGGLLHFGIGGQDAGVS